MSKGPDKSGGRTPTESESDLWRRAMGDVTPLKRRREAPPRAPAPEPPAAGPATPSAKTAARPRPRPAATAVRPPAPPPPPELAPGVAPGVDRRTATRLRRGKMDVEATIDLHGYTQVQAQAALDAFIRASADGGRRCVLVITGKGSRGEGGGVIRAAVPRWLNDPALRPQVLAFHNAHPRDGGDGALYVLLKRRRDRGARP